MIATIVFIVLVLYVALKTILWETRHDHYIILAESYTKRYSKKWKTMGALIAGSEIVAISACIASLIGWKAVFLFVVLSFVYSICHDCGMGYRLGKGIFHLGTGRWDEWVLRIFQRKGWKYFAFKCFWLLLMSLGYFAL